MDARAAIMRVWLGGAECNRCPSARSALWMDGGRPGLGRAAGRLLAKAGKEPRGVCLSQATKRV